MRRLAVFVAIACATVLFVAAARAKTLDDLKAECRRMLTTKLHRDKVNKARALVYEAKEKPRGVCMNLVDLFAVSAGKIPCFHQQGIWP